MTYLEKYLKENNCTVEDFWQAQHDYVGFCPTIFLNGCPEYVDNCKECWSQEVKE